MEGIMKKVNKVKQTEVIIQRMQGSAEPWQDAIFFINGRCLDKTLKKSQAPYVLIAAAAWIGKQYQCVFEEKQRLEGKVEFLAQQTAAFSNENTKLRNEIASLTKRLSDTQTAVQELCSQRTDENAKLRIEITSLKKHLGNAKAAIEELHSERADLDHLKCLFEIEPLKKQNAIVAADNTHDTGFVAPIKDDSDVETLVENNRTVAVVLADEISSGETSSDSESVRSHNSNASNESHYVYGQRRGYAWRPVVRCFVCQRLGHIARYCFFGNNSRPRNSCYPRTAPRDKEVYSARWGDFPRHVGQNERSFRTQISRLRSMNNQLKQERHQFIEQLEELKMQMASFTQRCHPAGNNPFVGNP